MSKEKSITESEAERIIKENEEKIDGTKEKKEKEKKTTLVGSKKTPVDTKPEVEYKN